MLGGERYCLFSRSVEREGEPGEHDEIGLKSDAGEAANVERSKGVIVLQAAELALDGNAAAVERGPLLAGVRRARVHRSRRRQHGTECLLLLDAEVPT